MTRLEIAPGAFACPHGALLLEAHHTLVVADLHLGYGWAQRRRGQLGPLGDGGIATALLALLDALKPQTLVLAGDIVHAPKPAPPERRFVEETLLALATRANLRLLPGNHDRRFAFDFPALPIEPARELLLPPWLIVHGDRPCDPGPHTLIAGHFHPSYALHDNAGAKHRLPVFLAGQRAILLPAFSPFAAGSDIQRHIPPAFRELLGPAPQAFATTARRVVPLGSVKL